MYWFQLYQSCIGGFSSINLALDYDKLGKYNYFQQWYQLQQLLKLYRMPDYCCNFCCIVFVCNCVQIDGNTILLNKLYRPLRKSKFTRTGSFFLMQTYFGKYARKIQAKTKAMIFMNQHSKQYKFLCHKPFCAVFDGWWFDSNREWNAKHDRMQVQDTRRKKCHRPIRELNPHQIMKYHVKKSHSAMNYRNPTNVGVSCSSF